MEMPTERRVILGIDWYFLSYVYMSVSIPALIWLIFLEKAILWEKARQILVVEYSIYIWRAIRCVNLIFAYQGWPLSYAQFDTFYSFCNSLVFRKQDIIHIIKYEKYKKKGSL